MTEVVWEDPPERKGRGASLEWFWIELRAHPGRWARYPGKPNSIHAMIRGKKGQYEATNRGTGSDGKGRVAYVRYLGANGDGAA